MKCGVIVFKHVCAYCDHLFSEVSIHYFFQIAIEDLRVSKKKKNIKDYVTYPPRMVFKIVQAPNTTETILEHALKVEGISPIKDFNIMVLPHSVVSTRPPPSRCSSDETTASASSYNSFSSCTSSENDRNESGKPILITLDKYCIL